MKYFVLCLFILFISYFNISDANIVVSQSRDFKELDSVNIELHKCTSDTCRYYIFQKQCSKYYAKDSIRYKYYTECALYELRNTSNPKFIGKAYLMKGQLARMTQKPDSLVYYCEKALEYAENTNDLYTIAVACRNLSSASLSQGEISKTIQYLKKAEYAAFRLNWLYYTYNFVEEITFHYTNMGQLDSALMYINNSIEKHKTIGSDEYVIKYYNLLAYKYHHQAKPKQTLDCFYYALAVANNAESNKLLAEVYSSIGYFILTVKDANPVALEYFQNAIDYSDTEDSMFISNNYNAIGDFYLQINTPGMAKENFLKAIEYSPEMNKNCHISLYYKGLALSYQHMEQFDSAIYYYNYALKVNKGISRFVFHPLADCYFKSGNYPEAINYYNESYKILSTIHDKILLSKLTRSMGDFYLGTQQINLAEKYYLLSYKEASELNDYRLMISASEALRKFFSNQKKYQLAHKYAAINIAASDSLNKMDKLTNMAVFETKFEFDKLKETNRITAEEAKRVKLFRNSLLLISFLLIFIGVIIYRSYKVKKRDNALLCLQKNELEDKNKEIEQVSRKLHESDQMKLRFFTNISHELRTPLTLLISPLERISSKLKGDDGEHFVNIMLRNADKLKNLINQQLDISKMDSVGLKLEKDLHDFNKLFQVTTSIYCAVANDKNIQFNVLPAQQELVFIFDKERLEQVITNLLSNAFKFTPAGGTITAGVSKHDDTLIFSVKDSGIGIPKEDSDKVFNRFYQSTRSINENYEGTGLGLSIVKEYIELHEGSIFVLSKEGEGCEFTVKLPLHFSEYNNNDRVQHTSKISTNSQEQVANYKEIIKQANGNSSTILIVEDNKDLRDYLKTLFQKQYKVLEASNGEIAKQKATEENPDLVISDVMMPICDGYQLTEYLKSHIETSHIPIILLTAKVNQTDKLAGYTQGADDYIAKPFNEKELILKVQNVLITRIKQREKYKRSITINPSKVTIESLDEKLLRQIGELIEKHISDQDYKLEQLSADVGMSYSNLYRKIKAITGQKPSQLIISYRLEKAAHLIKQNSMAISEIGYNLGFGNPSHFTRCFKEKFKCLPSEYISMG